MALIFRKDIFVSTLIITFFIFVLGFFIGYQLDHYRIQGADSILKEGELDTQSVFIEQEFVNAFALNDCNLLSSRINILAER